MRELKNTEYFILNCCDSHIILAFQLHILIWLIWFLCVLVRSLERDLCLALFCVLHSKHTFSLLESLCFSRKLSGAELLAYMTLYGLWKTMITEIFQHEWEFYFFPNITLYCLSCLGHDYFSLFRHESRIRRVLNCREQKCGLSCGSFETPLRLRKDTSHS